MLPAATCNYLIGYLLQDTSLVHLVGYTDNIEEFSNYSVAIVPSPFFSEGVYGSHSSVPALPLLSYQGVPILFGSPLVERVGNTVVIYADIVASAFFLLTRYEELVLPERDRHGRLSATLSLLGRAGLLHRALVEEYGALLRQWLREQGISVAEPASVLANIYLTHDADKLTQFRNWRGALGGLFRLCYSDRGYGWGTLVKSIFGGALHDPLFTFPWLVKQNRRIGRAQSVLFIKSGTSSLAPDQPCYPLGGADAQALLLLCKAEQIAVGMHASYGAGAANSRLEAEKKRLTEAVGTEVEYNRHHYLRSCSPADFAELERIGIRHDFTMGFADCAGFRLGTCRAVRWIDPKTKELTSLTLHPLTLMDVSLSNESYMNLSESEAYDYAVRLIEVTRKWGGELVLLWHNSSVSTILEYRRGYHRRLYERIITYLEQSG